MCWLIWIVSSSSVVQDIYDWLTMLQHRWQDSAWIATFNWNEKRIIKGLWLVRDVFKQKDIIELQGNIWIWHVRYPTAWCHTSSEEAQPFYVNSPFWIILAHNWNLTNTEHLTKDICEKDFRHLSTKSDSEILLNVLAHELSEIWKKQLNAKDIFNAIWAVHMRCKWAYAVVWYIFWHWMIAFRDPFWIRPLCYWEKVLTNWKKEYIIASESVAINSLWYRFVRDVKPWEAIFIDQKWILHSKVCFLNPVLSPCIFEHIYFARPDSIIDTISVYKARLRLWENLWKKILKEIWNNDIDVVMPIPDTSRTTAVQVAHTLWRPLREWFIKNRYIGRTFIMPWQEVRKKSIRQKLNPIELEFRNKNVLLVDDSIVRWNTCNEIIKMARNAWAKKIFFASSAPQIKYLNVYWIDIPTRNELIANWRTNDDIRKEIWADYLVFQDLKWIESIVSWWKNVYQFEMSCFNWIYCTWDITEDYLNHVESKRL